MNMDRSRRLRALWNWLPAFRAVAETEHLPTASDALHVSPASLSRTIGLLEQELGSLLFDRVGRGLRLNQQGALLLDSVRDGMRVIDEGVSGVEGHHWSGRVTLWAARCYVPMVLFPLVKQLGERHPGLSPVIQSHAASRVASQILKGQIDLAIVEQPLVHEQLRTRTLSSLEYGVYCPATHALAEVGRVSLAELAANETFAVPAPTDDQGLVDRFPAQHHRSKLLVVADLNMAMEASSQLNLLTVLPDIMADTAATKNLQRLSTEALPGANLYACFRKPVGSHPRVEAILEILDQNMGAGAV